MLGNDHIFGGANGAVTADVDGDGGLDVVFGSVESDLVGTNLLRQ